MSMLMRELPVVLTLGPGRAVNPRPETGPGRKKPGSRKVSLRYSRKKFKNKLSTTFLRRFYSKMWLKGKTRLKLYHIKRLYKKNIYVCQGNFKKKNFNNTILFKLIILLFLKFDFISAVNLSFLKRYRDHY